MWRLFTGVLMAIAVVGMVYLVFCFHRFSFFKRLSEKHKALSWLLAALPVAAAACFGFINVTTMAIVLLHMILFWALCDGVGFVVRLLRRKRFERNYSGAAALILSVLYLGAGWFFAHHIYETDYTFSTAKNLGRESLRIVEIADAHLGITLDGEDFARQMERVQQTEADVVVIVGDFVDDDTDEADMLRACQALGELNTTYGVYFAYGNHDNGYFRYRNFTSQQLRTALAENGVTILEDEAVLIDDSFYIIGRRDRSMWGRMEAQALTSELDRSKFMILLDHQPNDYANEAAAEADLVLSGHTHGGHIFPAGLIGLAMGANDNVYGPERRGDTDFVVTSGISGWAIPFKTGTISEYVVIDVVPEA